MTVWPRSRMDDRPRAPPSKNVRGSTTSLSCVSSAPPAHQPAGVDLRLSRDPRSVASTPSRRPRKSSLCKERSAPPDERPRRGSRTSSKNSVGGNGATSRSQASSGYSILGEDCKSDGNSSLAPIRDEAPTTDLDSDVDMDFPLLPSRSKNVYGDDTSFSCRARGARPVTSRGNVQVQSIHNSVTELLKRASEGIFMDDIEDCIQHPKDAAPGTTSKSTVGCESTRTCVAQVPIDLSNGQLRVCGELMDEAFLLGEAGGGTPIPQPMYLQERSAEDSRSHPLPGDSGLSCLHTPPSSEVENGTFGYREVFADGLQELTMTPIDVPMPQGVDVCLSRGEPSTDTKPPSTGAGECKFLVSDSGVSAVEAAGDTPADRASTASRLSLVGGTPHKKGSSEFKDASVGTRRVEAVEVTDAEKEEVDTRLGRHQSDCEEGIQGVEDAETIPVLISVDPDESEVVSVHDDAVFVPPRPEGEESDFMTGDEGDEDEDNRKEKKSARSNDRANDSDYATADETEEEPPASRTGEGSPGVDEIAKVSTVDENPSFPNPEDKVSLEEITDSTCSLTLTEILSWTSCKGVNDGEPNKNLDDDVAAATGADLPSSSTPTDILPSRCVTVKEDLPPAPEASGTSTNLVQSTTENISIPDVTSCIPSALVNTTKDLLTSVEEQLAVCKLLFKNECVSVRPEVQEAVPDVSPRVDKGLTDSLDEACTVPLEILETTPGTKAGLLRESPNTPELANALEAPEIHSATSQKMAQNEVFPAPSSTASLPGILSATPEALSQYQISLAAPTGSEITSNEKPAELGDRTELSVIEVTHSGESDFPMHEIANPDDQVALRSESLHESSPLVSLHGSTPPVSRTRMYRRPPPDDASMRTPSSETHFNLNGILESHPGDVLMAEFDRRPRTSDQAAASGSRAAGEIEGRRAPLRITFEHPGSAETTPRESTPKGLKSECLGGRVPPVHASREKPPRRKDNSPPSHPSIESDPAWRTSTTQHYPRDTPSDGRGQVSSLSSSKSPRLQEKQLSAPGSTRVTSQKQEAFLSRSPRDSGKAQPQSEDDSRVGDAGRFSAAASQTEPSQRDVAQDTCWFPVPCIIADETVDSASSPVPVKCQDRSHSAMSLLTPGIPPEVVMRPAATQSGVGSRRIPGPASEDQFCTCGDDQWPVHKVPSHLMRPPRMAPDERCLPTVKTQTLTRRNRCSNCGQASGDYKYQISDLADCETGLGGMPMGSEQTQQERRRELLARAIATCQEELGPLTATLDLLHEKIRALDMPEFASLSRGSLRKTSSTNHPAPRHRSSDALMTSFRYHKSKGQTADPVDEEPGVWSLRSLGCCVSDIFRQNVCSPPPAAPAHVDPGGSDVEVPDPVPGQGCPSCGLHLVPEYALSPMARMYILLAQPKTPPLDPKSRDHKRPADDMM